MISGDVDALFERYGPSYRWYVTLAGVFWVAFANQFGIQVALQIAKHLESKTGLWCGMRPANGVRPVFERDGALKWLESFVLMLKADVQFA